MRTGSDDNRSIYTIGHSNQTVEHLIELLRLHAIQVVVDVRSAPYSRFATQFNRRDLERAIHDAGLRYLYLGQELGGRPQDPSLYDRDGHADYQRISETESFRAGIERLRTGLSQNIRIALMCSEEDPTDCHRRLLIATVLTQDGVAVRHIRGDGRIDEECDLPQTVLDRPEQASLFEDTAHQGRATWRSTRSVLPRRPPSSSLDS